MSNNNGRGILATWGSSLVLTNTTVSGNRGGGLSGTLMRVENSTVSGNSTEDSGGGIYVPHPWPNRATLTLTNSTVSGNTASTGGGVHSDPADDVIFSSSIIAGNSALVSGPDCMTSPTSAGYNLIGDDSGCAFVPSIGDLVNIDPLLGPLQDNGGPTFTHALLPGSPAIDAGSPDCPPPDTDQRGVPRPQGSGCDIGAYELVPPDTVTIGRAIFANLFKVLGVSAESSASPEAELYLTVPNCLIAEPMRWSDDANAYVFLRRVTACGVLDGQSATVTSSYGGVATATIR